MSKNQQQIPQMTHEIDIINNENFLFPYESLWTPQMEQKIRLNIVTSIVVKSGTPSAWLFTARNGRVMKKKKDKLSFNTIREHLLRVTTDTGSFTDNFAWVYFVDPETKKVSCRMFSQTSYRNIFTKSSLGHVSLIQPAVVSYSLDNTFISAVYAHPPGFAPHCRFLHCQTALPFSELNDENTMPVDSYLKGVSSTQILNQCEGNMMDLANHLNFNHDFHISRMRCVFVVQANDLHPMLVAIEEMKVQKKYYNASSCRYKCHGRYCDCKDSDLPAYVNAEDVPMKIYEMELRTEDFRFVSQRIILLATGANTQHEQNINSSYPAVSVCPRCFAIYTAFNKYRRTKHKKVQKMKNEARKLSIAEVNLIKRLSQPKQPTDDSSIDERNLRIRRLSSLHTKIKHSSFKPVDSLWTSRGASSLKVRSMQMQPPLSPKLAYLDGLTVPFFAHHHTDAKIGIVLVTDPFITPFDQVVENIERSPFEILVLGSPGGSYSSVNGKTSVINSDHVGNELASHVKKEFSSMFFMSETIFIFCGFACNFASSMISSMTNVDYVDEDKPKLKCLFLSPLLSADAAARQLLTSCWHMTSLLTAADLLDSIDLLSVVMPQMLFLENAEGSSYPACRNLTALQATVTGLLGEEEFDLEQIQEDCDLYKGGCLAMSTLLDDVNQLYLDNETLAPFTYETRLLDEIVEALVPGYKTEVTKEEEEEESTNLDDVDQEDGSSKEEENVPAMNDE
ncbi:hypothetical protein PCE1_004869 [Barthelona sp. PCE]